MRAHLARTMALIAGAAVTGLAGCRASGLGEGEVATAPLAAVEHCSASVARATGRIAFVSDRSGNPEIFTMNADGGGLTQLTNDPATDDHPAWSPDGTKIAFSRQEPVARDIFVTDTDGTGVIQLTDGPADDHEMAWSPDGTRIAFASDRDGNYDLFVVNVDGSGLRRLTRDPTDDREPAWSPDGTEIAFSSGAIGYRSSGIVGNYDLFVVNPDGTEMRKLTGGPGQDQNPAWSPDGQKIAWRIDRNGAGKLAVINSDGTGVTELASDPAFPGAWSEWSPDGSPAWSPDGTKIALSIRRTGNTDIFVLNADGCGAVNLTNHPATDDEPAWQPRTPSSPAPAKPAPPPVLPHTS